MREIMQMSGKTHIETDDTGAVKSGTVDLDVIAVAQALEKILTPELVGIAP